MLNPNVPPKPTPSVSRLGSDFSSSQLVVAICLLLVMALVCFAFGVLVGRYDKTSSNSRLGGASAAESASDAQKTMPPPARKDAAAAPAQEGVQKSPRPVTMPTAKTPVPGFPASSSTGSSAPRVAEYPAPGAAPAPPAKAETPPPAVAEPAKAPVAEPAKAPAAEPKPAEAPATAAPAEAPAAVPAAAPVAPPAETSPAAAETKTVAVPSPAEKKAEAPADAKSVAPAAAASAGAKPAAPLAHPSPASTPPAPPAETKESNAKGAYGIQVASFSGANRQKMANECKKRLESNTDMKADMITSEDGKFIRVLVGHYPDKETASKACNDLKQRAGFAESFVKKR